MSQLITDEGRSSTPQDQPGAFARLATLAAVVGVVSILGIGIYSYSTRAALSGRIANLERLTADQLTGQLQTIKSEHASVVSDVAVVVDRVGATAQALDTTRGVTDTLTREHARTARTAAANAAAVKAVREQTETRVAEVDTKVAGVSNDVKAVATGLAAARLDVADNTRKVSSVTTITTSLSEQVGKNVNDLSELRRRGERDFAEFDIRKGSSPETWTVAGIRVELKKADERKFKYDAILHVEDRRLEKKDRTMNEPVPFLVGRDKLRYELVVTAIDHDRIRGYVSMPKDRSLAVEGSSALQ